MDAAIAAKSAYVRLPDRTHTDIHRMFERLGFAGPRYRTLAAKWRHFAPSPLQGQNVRSIVAARSPRTAPSSDATATAASGPLPQALPGFDIAAARKRLGGNDRLLAELMRTFAAEHGACAAQIDALLRESRPAAAAGALHRVKSAALIVGAQSVAAAAHEAEDDIRHARTPDMTAFANALSAAVENIARHVVPPDSDTADSRNASEP